MNPIRWPALAVRSSLAHAPAACAALLVLAGLGLATSPSAARDNQAEGRRIVEVLRLANGMVAADVGAGEGEFTGALARAVGAQGRVYATEIAQAKLDEIRQRMERDGIENVVTLLGDQQQTGLPAGCCDRILLRLVYHHFAEPRTMQRGLWDALRPGGQIAVVDVPPKKGWPRVPEAPDRGGHGIDAAELVADMERAGFEVAARHDDWPAEPESYCIVFRRPPDR